MNTSISRPEPVEAQQTKRIQSLDGLRGLAILMVLLFHTYTRWPEYIPWVTVHREFYPFKYGFLGVELFFLISGFVIYMTLEKCRSFPEFMLRRWLRLFPAMLIGSALIYATSFFLNERPNGEIQPVDLLPGLLFIDDGLINKAQNVVDTQVIEGAFWSLFVEVKFYLIFGALYFFRKRFALHGLIALFMAAFAYETVVKLWPAFQYKPLGDVLFTLLSLKYFGWFCVGALMYKAHVTGHRKFVVAATLMMVPTVLIMYGKGTTIVTACGLVYAVFYLALNQAKISALFQNRCLVFLGFVSYPLYLIHENAMVAMTIKTRANFGFIPDLLTPLPGIAALLCIAYFMAKLAEPNLRQVLARLVLAKRLRRAPA